MCLDVFALDNLGLDFGLSPALASARQGKPAANVPSPPSGKEGGQSSDATNNTCKHQINLSFSKNLRERVNSKDTKSKGPKED